MRRLHLFEIADQRWCPKSLRGAVHDYLQFGTGKWKIDITFACMLRQELIEPPPARQVIDLCSGSGGPWLPILQFFKETGLSVRVCFTDKYPNVLALKHLCSTFPEKCGFSEHPVDAKNVPESLSGFRTIFSGFHHFHPTQARAILRNAVNSGQGIAIFEITQRTPWALLNFMAISFLMPLCIPFVRPFRWSRLVWTYLIPLAPLVQLIDSLVSCLRSYSVSELEEFTRSIDSSTYAWEVGEAKLPHAPVPITYLFGHPYGEPGKQNEKR